MAYADRRSPSQQRGPEADPDWGAWRVELTLPDGRRVEGLLNGGALDSIFLKGRDVADMLPSDWREELEETARLGVESGMGHPVAGRF